MTATPRTVGILGLGSMGRPMAGHVIAAGHDTVVLHRSLHKADGARAVDTPRHMARQADVVVLLLPGAPEIDGVLDELAEGALARDDASKLVVAVSSTVSPDDIARWHRDHPDLEFVDAPISGGEAGAIRGDLSIMVGGDDAAAVRLVSDVLSSCGRPVHLGPLGAGQVAKACNQLICAAEIVALSEASVVAERAGLDLAQLLDLLQGGYAGSVIMNDKTPKLVAHDYSVSAAASFVHKDVSAYLDAARATGTRSVLGGPIAEAAAQLIEDGLGEQDSAVFQKWVADRSGE